MCSFHTRPPKTHYTYSHMEPSIPTPSQFDALLVDLESKDLHLGVAKALGVNYLVNTTEPPTSVVSSVKGILYGRNKRPFICMPVQIGTLVKDVIFLVDISPYTCLSEEVILLLCCSFNVIIHFLVKLLRVLGADVKQESFNITLNGVPRTVVSMSPNNSHFSDINILGADFLTQTAAELLLNYQTNVLTIKCQ